MLTRIELKEQLMKLPPAERLDLGQELVDSVSPVTPEQEAELDRRLREYRENPAGAIPAAEVHARIDALIDG